MRRSIARRTRPRFRRCPIHATRWSVSMRILRRWHRAGSLRGLNQRWRSTSVHRAGVRTMSEVTYLEAIREALFEEMERDENVFCLGEDIGAYGGAFKVTECLAAKYGEQRVI